MLLPCGRIDVRIDHQQRPEPVATPPELGEPLVHMVAGIELGPEGAGGDGVHRGRDGVERVGQRAGGRRFVRPVRGVLGEVVGAVEQRAGQVAQPDLGVFERGERGA